VLRPRTGRVCLHQCSHHISSLSARSKQAREQQGGGCTTKYPYPRSTNVKGHSLGIVAGAGAGERRGLLAGGELPAVSEGVRYKSLCPLEGCGGVYTRFWSPTELEGRLETQFPFLVGSVDSEG